MRPAGSPGAAPVAVSVSAESAPGRTPDGVAYHAARARAEVRLHRARVAVESRPIVATDAGASAAGALADLVERVAVVLSY